MRASLFFAFVLLAACGGGAVADDAGSDAGVDLGTDAPFASPDMDGHGAHVSGLGDTCAGELCTTAMEACVASQRSCTTGLCLTDPHAPLGTGDYCTTECAPSACAAGFHCALVRGAVAAACVADAAVCGDGTLERGEACDDGNTTAGDGCGPTCLREPPAFERVTGDLSLSATELALDGGAGVPRVAVTHVSTSGGADGGCGAIYPDDGDGGAAPDGAAGEALLVRACPSFGSADVHATLAWAPGTYDVDTDGGPYALAVCADLRFADAPGCTQRYCAARGATPTSATWTVTPLPDGGVHGRFDAHLVQAGAATPDADAGCLPVYGAAMDVSGLLDRMP